MMLAGFEMPTSGSISVDNRQIVGVPPEKRDIGMVFQNYALFPHMTVAQNIAFPLKVRDMPRAEITERVTRVLRMVNLENFGARYPRLLSGGQQQRVALARALVFEPRLVLMDEPLGALDKQLRERMQLEIKHIHEQLGITIVYVTHDQGEALTMSDRIAVFSDGHLQQVATPQELYEQPKNSFVARFIGESNHLQGTITSLESDNCQVRLHNNQVVRARSTNFSNIGQETSLSIRPERVRINPDPGTMPNIFSGKIEELIYLGDHLRIRLSTCGNNEFIAKVQLSEKRPSIEVGMNIEVGWEIPDCLALNAA